MSFEKFLGINRYKAARVSITNQQLLSFSSAAVAQYGLTNYSHVVLFYDSDSKTIGFVPTNDYESEGARLIRFRQTGADISLQSFMNYFNIPTGRKEYKIDKHEDMYILRQIDKKQD